MWTHSRSSGRRGVKGGRTGGTTGDAVIGTAGIEPRAVAESALREAGLREPGLRETGLLDGTVNGSWLEADQHTVEPLALRRGGNSAAGEVAEREPEPPGMHGGEPKTEVDPEPALEPQPRNTTGLDVEALRESMALAEDHLDELGVDFYAQLFAIVPETRELFGAGMEVQRSRLLGALIRIVGSADDRDELVPYLEGLGRDHRKFGVIDKHYAPLGTALVLALRRTLGDSWTSRYERAWIQAYDSIANTMAGAARRDAVIAPPWWDGEVVYHRRVLDDLAIIQVRPHTDYPYRPGQYAYITTPRRPKIWRAYSLASAPRDDGLLEFHVRTVGAGWVSSALVWRTEPGDVLHLGAPQGHDVATPRSEHDLLCIAAGTGISPVLATLQELEQRQDGRRVHVFYAGRDRDHLYALPHLESIGVRYRRLTVVPVVSPDGPTDRSPDLMGNIVAAYGDWRKHRVYVAGPTAMVSTSLERLREQGVPEEQVVVDDYGLW